MRFWLLFTSICCSTQNNNIRPTSCTLQDRFESSRTCSYIPQDSFWVECASWLLLITLWLEANKVFLRTSHFFWKSSSPPFPLKQIMGHGTIYQSASGYGSSRMTGSSSNVPPNETQHQHRHQLVHHDAAYADPNSITQVAHLQMICQARSSKI